MIPSDTVYHDTPYLGLLRKIYTQAKQRPDRTGVGTFGLFGEQLRYDLSKGFPLLTTKKTNFRSIVLELLWLLSGDTNAKTLQNQGVRIWDEWADEDGSLGPVYGAQWRAWPNPVSDNLREAARDLGHTGVIDQIAQLIENLKTKPFDRGHVVSAWNVADLPKMRLRPCHCLFQFRVEELGDEERAALLTSEQWEELKSTPKLAWASFFEEREIPKLRLDCQLYQRSADIFLGVPFNMASYALLTTLIAQQVNMVPGHFVHTFGDVHIYTNHLEQVEEQLSRIPYPSPTVRINHKSSIDDYVLEDFELVGYESHGWIKAPVAV
jgi:thymidylate synthase